MLGQTFVKAFAKEGAKIALLVRSLDKASPLLAEIRADGGIIAAYPSDVLNKESLRKARELINQELGTCDILINGAGGNSPKATAYDFLQTLYQVDVVYYKDRNLKTYVIGAKMYSIGSSYTRDSNLIAAGTELLQNFAKRYTQTVFITKQNGAKIVYVYKHKDDGAIISVPLSAGSVTTTKENDVVRETYTYFAAKTPHFRHFSGQINNLDYIEAISVPIFNFENKCVGTIVSCDYADKMVEHKDLVNDFINISKIISSKLGYLG